MASNCPTRRNRSGAPTGALGASALVWSSVRTVRPSLAAPTVGSPKPGVAFHCSVSLFGQETTVRKRPTTPAKLSRSASKEWPWSTGSAWVRVMAKSRISPVCRPSICREAVIRPSRLACSRLASRRRISMALGSSRRSMALPLRMIFAVWKVTLSVSGFQTTLIDFTPVRPSGFRILMTRRL